MESKRFKAQLTAQVIQFESVLGNDYKGNPIIVEGDTEQEVRESLDKGIKFYYDFYKSCFDEPSFYDNGQDWHPTLICYLRKHEGEKFGFIIADAFHCTTKGVLDI